MKRYYIAQFGELSYIGFLTFIQDMWTYGASIGMVWRAEDGTTTSFLDAGYGPSVVSDPTAACNCSLLVFELSGHGYMGVTCGGRSDPVYTILRESLLLIQ